MKTTARVFGLVMAMVLMVSFSTQAATVVGDTHTEAGQYWLKRAASHMTVNNKELKTYVIHFDNVSSPVYIGVLESNDVYSQFLVKSEGFEVMYTAINGQLGIQYVPESVASMPQEQSIRAINREQFLRQRIITQNATTEDQMLSLIACYVPEVMK